MDVFFVLQGMAKFCQFFMSYREWTLNEWFLAFTGNGVYCAMVQSGKYLRGIVVHAQSCSCIVPPTPDIWHRANVYNNDRRETV